MTTHEAPPTQEHTGRPGDLAGPAEQVAVDHRADVAPPPPPPPDWWVATPTEARYGAAGAVARAGTVASSRWSLLTMAALGSGACLYLALVDPNTSSAYPQCPLRALTGWDCAGCGGLRAAHALLTGDVPRALDHNVLAVLVAPLLAYGIVQVLAARWGRTLPGVRWRGWMTPAILALVLGFSVVRNLDWGPLRYLYSDPA